MLRNTKRAIFIIATLLVGCFINFTVQASTHTCNELYNNVRQYSDAKHQVAVSLIIFFQWGMGASRSDACELAKQSSLIVTDRLEIYSEFHTDLASLTKAVYDDVFKMDHIRDIFRGLSKTGAVVSSAFNGVSKINNILKAQNKRGANYYKLQSTVAVYLYYFKDRSGRNIVKNTRRYYLTYHWYWGEKAYISSGCGSLSCR
jgi:hypothetical protein